MFLFHSLGHRSQRDHSGLLVRCRHPGRAGMPSFEKMHHNLANHLPNIFLSSNIGKCKILTTYDYLVLLSSPSGFMIENCIRSPSVSCSRANAPRKCTIRRFGISPSSSPICRWSCCRYRIVNVLFAVFCFFTCGFVKPVLYFYFESVHVYILDAQYFLHFCSCSFFLSRCDQTFCYSSPPFFIHPTQGFVYGVPVSLLAGFRLDDFSSHFWIFYACIVCLYLGALFMSVCPLAWSRMH